MVTIPGPFWKPLRTSWNLNAVPICWFIIPDIVFHITSTRAITQKLPLPLGRRTTICHVRYTRMRPSLNSVCMRSKTRSRASSWGAAIIYSQKCSSTILNGRPDWWLFRRRMAHSTISSWGKASSIRNGAASTRMMFHGGWGCKASPSLLSSVQ